MAGAFTSTSDTLAADGTETSTAFTPAPLTVFHPGLRDEWREKFAQSFAVTEDFVSEEEEAGLAKEVEPHLRRQVYQQDHWDDVRSSAEKGVGFAAHVTASPSPTRL